jgi:hypothetical protein
VSKYIAGSIIMTLLVAVYLGFALVYAQVLLQDDSLLVNAMGGALLVFPVVGAWGIIAEWRFGFASSKLITILDREGALPDDSFPTTVSGRPIKDQALEAFPAFQKEVEASPESWRAWLRLALAYDACGDRRRARWATRKAIALSKSDPDITGKKAAA